MTTRAAVLALTGVLTLILPPPDGLKSKASGVLVVAPGGTGTACTAADPCGSINEAYERAPSGAVIELMGGAYADQFVRPRPEAESFASNVVVQPRRGESPYIHRLDVHGPRLTFRRLHVAGGFLWKGANHGRFEEMVVDGLLSIAGADHTAVVRSRLKPVMLDATPLLVGPENPNEKVPRDVVIEDNEIGPAYATDFHIRPETHNNTVMVRGVDGLAIRRNLLLEGGTSSTLQVSNTMGPVTNVLVENNFILGCDPRTPDGPCRSYYALQANGTAPLTTVVRNNTIRGALYNQNPDAVSFYGNILTRGTACFPNMVHNLIGPGLFTSCHPSNVTGVLPVFAEDGWHLAPGSPGIDFGVPGASTTDYDGDRRDGRPDAGADEVVASLSDVIGQTWLTTSVPLPSGPPGSTVKAYASGAAPGLEYRMVSASGRCDTDVRAMSDRVRRASADGAIPVTAGRIDRPPGRWQVCFRTLDGRVATGPVIFTVT